MHVARHYVSDQFTIIPRSLASVYFDTRKSDFDCNIHNAPHSIKCWFRHNNNIVPECYLDAWLKKKQCYTKFYKFENMYCAQFDVLS